MRGSIRIGERELYRFGNVLLLALIALFGAGRFLGVENPGGWHVLVVLTVLLFLLAVHFLSGQKKWFFLLAVFICFGFVATAIGIKQTGSFLRSYMQWLAGSEGVPIAEEAQAAWRARLYWYGLLQTGLITIVCYLLQLLLEQFPAVKNGFAGGLPFDTDGTGASGYGSFDGLSGDGSDGRNRKPLEQGKKTQPESLFDLDLSFFGRVCFAAFFHACAKGTL